GQTAWPRYARSSSVPLLFALVWCRFHLKSAAKNLGNRSQVPAQSTAPASHGILRQLFHGLPEGEQAGRDLSLDQIVHRRFDSLLHHLQFPASLIKLTVEFFRISRTQFFEHHVDRSLELYPRSGNLIAGHL